MLKFFPSIGFRVLPDACSWIEIPRPVVIELGFLVELLAGEAVGDTGIVGDLVDPGFAEGEVFEVLVDLARGIGDEARRAQMVLVVKVLVDLGEVLGPRAVAFAGGELLELGRNARSTGEHLLRVPPEGGDVPRIDIERLAARTLLDDAVGVVVVFEGRRLRRAVRHRLHAVVFVPDDDPVLGTVGCTPARLVAVEVVAEGVLADLACRVRPAAAVGVGEVVGQRQVGRGRAVRQQVERGLRLVRNVVDAVVGHRQRELLRGYIGLGKGAGGTRQLVEVVVAEGVGRRAAVKCGARRDRRQVAKRENVAHGVVAVRHVHEGARRLGLGQEAREPPVERIIGVAGGRAVAERHLLAGLELVVADEAEIIIGEALLRQAMALILPPLS